MVERIKAARPMIDLMAKKVFSNPEITAQFIRKNIYHYRFSEKWCHFKSNRFTTIKYFRRIIWILFITKN